MTAWTGRRKKAALTAHVGYQPADLAPRRRRDSYHAIADQPVTLGLLTRETGHSLCGLTGPWPDPPTGLFPPLVTCPACRALADTARVTVAETP